MIETTLADIRRMAKDRPEGYYDAVVGQGVIDGESITFSDEAWAALKARFRPQPELPALDQMARNFWGSVAWWASNGFPMARRRDFIARLEQCQRNECGQWQGDGKIARCAACGCTGLKLWLASEECPKGFWNAVQGLTFKEGAKGVFRRLSERLKG
jgi:hypothetical protein